jgi:Tfp pilus assembly protein PilN
MPNKADQSSKKWLIIAGASIAALTLGGTWGTFTYRHHLKTEAAKEQAALAKRRGELARQMQQIEQMEQVERDRKKALENLYKSFQEEDIKAQAKNRRAPIQEPQPTQFNKTPAASTPVARDPEQWSDQGTIRICASARSYKRQTGRSILSDTANMGVWSPGQEIRNIYMNLSRACPDAL